jgi:succinate-semialdehyde dehydrogenase/glutarate-semialdehyde dehydrogenase
MSRSRKPAGTSNRGKPANHRAVSKVEEHIQDAVSKGAKVLAGGSRHQLGGSVFQPTVLSHVTPEMAVAREEIFGPLSPLFRFSEESEAIRLANARIRPSLLLLLPRSRPRVPRLRGTGIRARWRQRGHHHHRGRTLRRLQGERRWARSSKYGVEDYLNVKYTCIGGLAA